MKKIMSLVLSFVILAMALPAYAEKDDVQKLLASVKERIGETDKYTDFDSSTWQDDYGNRYSFYWNNDNENLSVSVNENGFISSYYYDNYNGRWDSKPSIKNVSIDDIYLKACEFVKQLNPDKADKLRVVKRNEYQSLTDGPVYFEVERIEKGVRVAGDNGSVEISADATTPTNFYCDFTENIKFDDINNIISQETAEKAYAEKIGWKLCYTIDYDTLNNEDAEKKVKLVYCINEKPMKYLSAKTGEVVELKSKQYGWAMEEAAKEDMSLARANGFTEAEQNELDGIAGLIPQKDAEKLVRNNKAIKLLSKYTLKSFRGYKSDEKYRYSMSFENNNNYVWIDIDAQTGEILSFRKTASGGKAKIKEEEAVAVAKNVIKILEPEHTEDYILDEDSKDGSYAFYRHINGLPFYENAIYIDVDMANGNVTGYSFNYDELEFPTTENVIPMDELCKKIFAENELKTVYVLGCSKDNMKEYDIAVPVYAFDDYSNVYSFDAISGEAEGENNEATEYTDISGHYAENAINELKKYGIGYAKTEFKPDVAISQKEFVAFAYNVLRWSGSIMLSGDDDDFSYYEKEAKREGIIGDEYNADGMITRGDASLILAKLMEFNKYAEIEGIYNCPFADVTKNIGQISILNGLKIINGDGNGNFNPENTLTRGDFAIILYNCLTK